MKKNISRLRDGLSSHLSINKSRSDCISLFIIALFTCCTINLQRIAECFSTDVKINSNYRRIQRLFKDITFDWVQLGCLIMKILGDPSCKFVVTIDRTNWDFGKKKTNYLVIAIVYKGMSIPIAFTDLNKKGNSHTDERIALMKRFLEIVPTERIYVVLADREFIGKNWFKFLKANKIPHAIRIRDNMIAYLECGSSARINRLFKRLKKGKTRVVKNCTVSGVKTNLKARKNRKGELMIIAYFGEFEECEIKLYKQRWSIECLFRNMKKKGFNLEDTHMIADYKLETLFGILAIATAWAVKTGEIRAKAKEVRLIKKKGKEYNLFSYGKQLISRTLSRDKNYKLLKIILKPFKQKPPENKELFSKEDIKQIFVVG